MWCTPYRPTAQYGKNREKGKADSQIVRQPWTGTTATKLPYLFRMQAKKKVEKTKEEKPKPQIRIEREFSREKRQPIPQRQCAEFSLKSQLPLNVCIHSQGIRFPPLNDKRNSEYAKGEAEDKDFMKKTLDPKLSFCREVLFDRGIVPYDPNDKFGLYFNEDREFRKRSSFQRNKKFYKPGLVTSHQLCISSEKEIGTERKEKVRDRTKALPEIVKLDTNSPESHEVEQLVLPENKSISCWEANALRMVSERTAQWIINCCSGTRGSEILQCVNLDKEPPSAIKKLLDIDDDLLDEIYPPRMRLSLPKI